MATLSVGGTTVFDGAALQSGVTGSPVLTLPSTTTFPAGHIISYKIEAVDGDQEATASTTYVEAFTALRITHALSNASNKLVFGMNSTDMYLHASQKGYVGVAKTTDVTTNILSKPILLCKHLGGTEVNATGGFAEYLPGVTTSFIYTIVFKATASSFYIANNTADTSVRFSLMEVVV